MTGIEPRISSEVAARAGSPLIARASEAIVLAPDRQRDRCIALPGLAELIVEWVQSVISNTPLVVIVVGIPRAPCPGEIDTRGSESDSAEVE